MTAEIKDILIGAEARTWLRQKPQRLFQFYLCGPMSGLPENNFPAFHEAAKFLRSNGYSVINPAELDEPDAPPMQWEDYLRRDIPCLCLCQKMALLPGWNGSRGAALEVCVAQRLKMPFYSAVTLERMANLDLLA